MSSPYALRPARRIALAIALLPTLPIPTASAAITPAAGWSNASVTAAPAGAFTGGMDLLPNGHAAIFDGSALIEVDIDTGSVIGTLFTPPSFVFGSFVKTDPTGTFVLFGESLNHDIYRIPLDGSPASVVGNIVFNYGAAFAPAGDVYVSGSPSVFGSTEVVRLDLATGATDVIASLFGPSGPIAFDAQGDLYYGEGSLVFPAPTGQQHVLRFSAAQVAAAIGPAVLDNQHATIFASGVTSPSDLVFDHEGDLFVSDSVDGTLLAFDAGGIPQGLLGSEAPFNAVGSLALRGSEAPGHFDAFQPQSAGTLVALSTDFFSFNDLNVLRPRRPALTTTPAAPILDGPYTLDLTGGPANGSALLLVSTATVTPELLINAVGASFLFGLDLNQLLVVASVPLDGNGALSIATTNTAAQVGSVAVQAVVIDAGGSPRGTSTPLQVTLL